MKDEEVLMIQYSKEPNDLGASLLSYTIAVAILLAGALLYIQSLEDAFDSNYERRQTEHDFTQREPLITPSP